MTRPPVPPFTEETAHIKVRAAEDAWNSRDPAKIALAYTTESQWRNRSEFVNGTQGNNAYIFPGIGLGAVACGASSICEEMFLMAAKTLAERVSEADLAAGAIYPPLVDIRAVSLDIAIAVAEVAYARGLARIPRPDNLERAIVDYMYDPVY